MKQFLVVLGSFFLVSSASCQYVKEKKSEDLSKITVSELADAIRSKSVFVVDNNTSEIYAEHHIPTAVHMNYREAITSILPPDKNAPLVFYCKNEWCMASHSGARLAINAGYNNVRILPDGIDGWIKSGQPVESGAAHE